MEFIISYQIPLSQGFLGWYNTPRAALPFTFPYAHQGLSPDKRVVETTVCGSLGFGYHLAHWRSSTCSFNQSIFETRRIHVSLFYQCWGLSMAEDHISVCEAMLIHSICKFSLTSFALPFRHVFLPSNVHALLCDSSQVTTEEKDAPSG